MLIDPERLSYALYKLIPDETEMIEKENPEIIMKSVKMILKQSIFAGRI